MPTFERSPKGVRVKLEEHEVGLLRQLLEEMSTLLEADIAADPVNKRLFPDAYDTEEDSQSYRELVGYELRSTKLAAVKDMLDTIDGDGPADTEISQDVAESWLAVLNDIRLAIGTRNEVTEEKMAEEPDPQDPDSAAMMVLHWLGWLQESLLGVL